MNLDRKYFWQKKKITMRYKQASAEETIQFINQDWNEKIIAWVVEFMKKYSDYREKDYRYVVGNFDKIFDTILKTYHKWVFNKEEIKNSGGSMMEKKTRKSTFWANLVYLSEKLNVHPKLLLQEYTMEQMNWLSEWLIFNSNEASKDGQRINDRLTRDKTDMTKEDIMKKFENVPD